jgi:hypothetical protein
MSIQSAAGFCGQETRVTQLLSSPGHVSQKELTPYRKPHKLKLRIDPKKSQKLPFCSVFIPTQHQLRVDLIKNNSTSKRFGALEKAWWRFASNCSILCGGAALRVHCHGYAEFRSRPIEGAERVRRRTKIVATGVGKP